MAKKRSSPPASATPDPAAAMHRDLHRLLSRQQFDSVDDVNAFLQEMMAQPLPSVGPVSDQERAEDLVDAARTERSAAKRRARLSEALALDPDCVSAHLLLAEEATSPGVAMAHARDAIAAGERSLGAMAADPQAFLWGDPIGRNWLLARGLLVELCWQRGDRPEAIAEARTVLRLNPSDNQGMRYQLLEMLLMAGSIADIDALLAAFPERSAHWLFSIALHRYRLDGSTPTASRALKTAMQANPHVALMLLGRMPMPPALPLSYGLGDEDEAALYVQAALPAWLDAGSALDWIDAAWQATPKRRARRPEEAS